jgi:hypothetical protein
MQTRSQCAVAHIPSHLVSSLHPASFKTDCRLVAVLPSVCTVWTTSLCTATLNTFPPLPPPGDPGDCKDHTRCRLANEPCDCLSGASPNAVPTSHPHTLGRVPTYTIVSSSPSLTTSPLRPLAPVVVGKLYVTSDYPQGCHMYKSRKDE